MEHEFNPTLTVKFEGEKIDFEGLENIKSGSITHHETEEATATFLLWSVPVGAMKTTSVLSTTSLAIFLALSLRFTLQERTSRTPMERLNGDVRDKIVEAVEPLEYIARVTIKVSSIDDLIKVSDETFKPIIRHGDTFYVLDGNIKYEIIMKVESKSEGKNDEYI